MTTALIAEDEPLLRRELREALSVLWPSLDVIGEYPDGVAALLAIQDCRPDIVFLDIRMPKLSGLEVAERIQGQCQIVFVTAYDEHAITAFDQGAADYLLKPVRCARLAATVQRLRERLERNNSANTVAPLERIQAMTGNTLRFINVTDICYFRSELKYTHVVTADSEALIRQSLTSLIPHLDAKRFWRINRGIAVNIDYIDRVVRDADGQMTVHLRNEIAQLPVSKPNQGQFRGM